MESLHLFLRIMALSQISLLFLYLLLRQRNAMGYLMALGVFSFGCYLILAVTFHRTGLDVLNTLLICFASSIPAIIWLTARWFFLDDKRIPPLSWLAWLGYMTLSIPDWGGYFPNGNVDLIQFIFGFIPQLIKLAFVAHVVYMALAGRKNDLVNQRLKFRVPVALGMGGLSVLVILVELWLSGTIPILIETTGSALMLLATLTLNLYLFRFGDNINLETLAEKPRGRLPQDEAVENYEKEIEQIVHQLTTERFYGRHGATLADLAEVLSLPPYKLRTIINQHMNYRNFNQFLNHYRIAEASERLITEAKLPILTIALDTGFNSLSSFNKAFREHHQQTPSDFRAQTK